MTARPACMDCEACHGSRWAAALAPPQRGAGGNWKVADGTWIVTHADRNIAGAPAAPLARDWSQPRGSGCTNSSLANGPRPAPMPLFSWGRGCLLLPRCLPSEGASPSRYPATLGLHHPGSQPQLPGSGGCGRILTARQSTLEALWGPMSEARCRGGSKDKMTKPSPWAMWAALAFVFVADGRASGPPILIPKKCPGSTVMATPPSVWYVHVPVPSQFAPRSLGPPILWHSSVAWAELATRPMPRAASIEPRCKSFLGFIVISFMGVVCTAPSDRMLRTLCISNAHNKCEWGWQEQISIHTEPRDRMCQIDDDSSLGVGRPRNGVTY